MFNIRDIRRWNVTWVNENTGRERDEAEKTKERENESVQRPS